MEALNTEQELSSKVMEDSIKLARAGRFKEALKEFEENLAFTKNPVVMSYYALCLAVVERDYEQGIHLCFMALKRDAYNPSIYLNTAKVLLMAGKKQQAIKALKRGLAIDNSNKALARVYRKLGVRKAPAIRFLGRNSSINKYIGMFLNRYHKLSMHLF